MIVLVGCECSGRVSAAFRKLGHTAISCDLQPTEDDPRWHIQGDVFKAIDEVKPDLGIFHPPCTHIASSGARWLTDHFVKKRSGPEIHQGERGYWHDGAAKRAAQVDAVEFVKAIWASKIPKLAIENPQGMLSSLWRPPDQYIQPWQHGDGFVKKTGLWLRGLPKIVPSNIVEGRVAEVWKEPPGPNRQRNRSRTYLGIARALADQWGK